MPSTRPGPHKRGGGVRHEWKYLPPIHPVGDTRRKCKNCGAVQTRESVTWYMRTIKYQWLPHIGRCQTEKD